MKLHVVQDQEPQVDTFDQFWQLYPRRVAKADARKAWAKVSERDRQKIIAVLPEHCKQEQWTRDGGKFIPYPATWLNGERWEDDLVILINSQLGQCCWNIHGNRGPEPRCSAVATITKSGVNYCAAHATRVN